MDAGRPARAPVRAPRPGGPRAPGSHPAGAVGSDIGLAAGEEATGRRTPITKLSYYTPRSALARLVAPLAATAVSYLPPRALRPLLVPLREISNHSRRPALRRRATRAIHLVVGDGMSIRVRRQRGGSS